MWMARSIFETCWGKKNPQDETHLPHNCRLRNLPKVKHRNRRFGKFASQRTNPLCWVNGKVAVQTPATGLRPITPGWNSHMSDRFMTGYDQTLPTCNGWKRSYESESRRRWNCGVLSCCDAFCSSGVPCDMDEQTRKLNQVSISSISHRASQHILRKWSPVHLCAAYTLAAASSCHGTTTPSCLWPLRLVENETNFNCSSYSVCFTLFLCAFFGFWSKL